MGTGDDIRDDEIRVIGEGNSNAGKAARGKKTVGGTHNFPVLFLPVRLTRRGVP